MVPTGVEQLNPFGLGSERRTGRTQQIGFLLQTAAVGYHTCRTGYCRHHFGIAQRIGRNDSSFRQVQPLRLSLIREPGMNSQYDGHRLRLQTRNDGL